MNPPFPARERAAERGTCAMRAGTTYFDGIECAQLKIRGGGSKLLALSGANNQERASVAQDGTLFAPLGCYAAANSGAAYSAAIPGYVPGRVYYIRLNAELTGASTLSVNGGAALPLQDIRGKNITGALAGAVLPICQKDAASNFLCPLKGGAYDIGDGITEDLNMALTVPGGTLMGTHDPGYIVARGVTVAPSGNIYFAGNGFHIIGPPWGVMKCDSGFNRIWVNAAPCYAAKIALDASENVYAAYDNDPGTVSVQKFDPDGNSLWALADIGNTWGIAADAAGYVYAAYRNASGVTLRKLDADGRTVWALSDVPNANDVAMGSDGYLYAVYRNAAGEANVRKLSASDGSQVWALTDIGNAFGVAVSGDSVYVTYDNAAGAVNVRRLSASDGSQVWADSSVGNARRVAADRWGNVFAAYENGLGGVYAQRFDADGRTRWRWGGSFSDFDCGYGIAACADGTVLVTSHDQASMCTLCAQLYGLDVYTVTA